MKIYLAADHAGFELKQSLLSFVRGELGHETEDCGALTLDPSDDYPGIIAIAARKLARDMRQGIESRAILIGASGQGEAMAANRFRGVRAALYYGPTGRRQHDATGRELGIIESVRSHNDANALSLAARFITVEEAKEAVRTWLSLPFDGAERNRRRITDLDALSGE